MLIGNIENMKTQRSSHTHLQAVSIQRTDQSLQKSVPAPPKKNFKIFSPTLLNKIKTPDTQAMTDKHSDNSVQTFYRQRNLTRTTEAHAHNKGLAKWRVQWLNKQLCYYLTLVLGDSEVLRMPPLRQAAKRYKPC
jgi:hypothetical protein